MDKNNPLIRKLIDLQLPPDDFAVFGSGPMFAHGIKDLGHDVDVVARKSAWDVAKGFGEVKKDKFGSNNVIEIYGGEIEIFDGWAPGDWNIDELIDTAEVIDGIRFVTLENVLKWKKMMGREKDLEHIKMITGYLGIS